MTRGLSIDLPPSLRRYLFVDVEASGLHAGSYPIEIGWCGVDLVPASFLIRPLAGWTEDDWSITSERVHGLLRSVVVAEGIDVAEAAERLNAAGEGREVVSDSPPFDQGWLSRLFQGAGVVQAFRLAGAARIEAEMARQSGLDPSDVAALRTRVEAHYPHPHRAAMDARRAAALFLAIAMPEAIETIVGAA